MATFGKAASALTLALVLVAGAADAGNPSPTDIATARELYREGADALDMGSPQAAVEKLAQAWALVQTPVIGADLARAQKALGRLVEARETALAVQRIPITHDETTRSTQARADADRIAAELEPKIAHLKITLVGVGDGYTPTLKLDGVALADATLSVPRQANPGEHTATLDTDDGRHAETKITLADGESREVTLEVGAPVGPPKPQKTEPRETIIVQQSPSLLAPESTRIPALVWVGIATTGVGIVTGALAGAFAFSEATFVKDNCHGVGADGLTYCSPAQSGDLAAANTLGIVSTIGFVTAGVGAALIIVGVVTTPKHRTAHAHIVPFIGPVSGIGGVF